MQHMGNFTDWDPVTYDRLALPHVEWARSILERLTLRGDEIILDAGCGTGRMAAALAELVPRGRVFAIDASPLMLSYAVETSGTLRNPRIDPIHKDLLLLDDEEHFDYVVSNAVFHWIPDLNRLMQNLFHALKRGGALISQCGAEGNMGEVLSAIKATMITHPFNRYFEDWDEPWHFAGAQEMKQNLKSAGFISIDVNTEEAPALFTTRSAYEEYVGELVLRPYNARLTKEMRNEFLKEVVDRVYSDTGSFVVDYIRLNMSAHKSS